MDTADQSRVRHAAHDHVRAAPVAEEDDDRGLRHRHAGRWIVLDARFLRLLSVGMRSYRGIAPRAALDPIARRILLPRMRTASRGGQFVATLVEDHGRRWNVRVEPLLGTYSGQVLGVRGCYWPHEQPMPATPPAGTWELRLTPPGPQLSMRSYWSPELFTVHDLPVPTSASPQGVDCPQWLDELVVEADRAETRLLQEDLVATTTDTLQFHAFRIRSPRTGGDHHLHSAMWRDLNGPGPHIWLRGISMRTSEPESSARCGTNRFVEALLTLWPDPVCAIDTAYEQVFLTTTRFAELGVPLPADRHLPRICHRDDLTALRGMLADAITRPHTIAGPVHIRLAQPDGWTTVELRGVSVRHPGRPARHVLCQIHRPSHAATHHAA